MSAAPKPLPRDPLAVCACMNPLCSDAEHAAGKCARCVKREALRAKNLCACGEKLAVTGEVMTGWCLACQARPMGFRLSQGYEDLVKQLEADRAADVAAALEADREPAGFRPGAVEALGLGVCPCGDDLQGECRKCNGQAAGGSR